MSWLEFALMPGLRRAIEETRIYARRLNVGVMVTTHGVSEWDVSLSALVPTGEVRRVPQIQFGGVRFRSSNARRWPDA